MTGALAPSGACLPTRRPVQAVPDKMAEATAPLADDHHAGPKR